MTDKLLYELWIHRFTHGGYEPNIMRATINVALLSWSRGRFCNNLFDSYLRVLTTQKAKIDLFIPETLMEKYCDEDVSNCHTMIHWWLCLKDTKVIYNKIMKSIEANEDDTWYMIRFVKDKNSFIYKHKHCITQKKKNLSDLQRKEKKQQSYTEGHVEEKKAQSEPVQTSEIDSLKVKGDKYERGSKIKGIWLSITVSYKGIKTVEWILSAYHQMREQ